MNTVPYEEFKRRFKENNLNKDYTLFKNTYNGMTKKMKFRHKKCNNTFEMIPKNLLNGQRCPICAKEKRRKANMIKFTNEELNFLKKNNFELVEFNGKTVKNKFKCLKCNSIFDMTYRELKNTNSCPICSVDKVNKINKNIEKYNKRLNKLDFEIMPEYFHGTTKKSKFKCLKCGKIQNGYYYNILYDTYHCDCSKNRTYNNYGFKYYQNKLKELKLDEEYYMYEDTFINSKTKMKFKHLKCNNIFWKTPTDFFSNNQHCKYCVNQGSFTKKELLKLLEDNDLILLSDIKQDKISKKKNFKVKCEICNAKFTTRVEYILNESICKCKKPNSKGENKIKEVLNSLNIEFETEKKFNDLKYKVPLRFDFYIKDKNIAIEFDGIQHFKPIEYFGGEEYLEVSRIRDEIKNTYCKKNNIKLIRIPYTDYNEIEFILKEELL